MLKHINLAAHDCGLWVSRPLDSNHGKVSCINLTGKALALGMFHAMQKNYISWTVAHEPFFNRLACIPKGASGDEVHAVLEQGELFHDMRHKCGVTRFKGNLTPELKPGAPDKFKALKQNRSVKTKRRKSIALKAPTKKQKSEASAEKKQEPEVSAEKKQEPEDPAEEREVLAEEPEAPAEEAEAQGTEPEESNDEVLDPDYVPSL